MNQGKLEVDIQEMARVNIDILEITELKWTGIGKFNSDDYYIYCCNFKNDRMISVHFICPIIIGYWKVKIGSQEIPGVTGKFSLGVKNEAGQRLIEFCQEKVLVIENTLLQQ